MTLILGIETSCDETAAAVVADGRVVRSNVVASQIDIHRRYGGVFPEVASRQHVLSIVPVIREALAEADVDWSDLAAVAVTYGPGLAGSLLVGVNAAKGLAWGRGLPLVGINHIEAHIYGNWLVEEPAAGAEQTAKAATTGAAEAATTRSAPVVAAPALGFSRGLAAAPEFPLMCLVVSGGHTELIRMTGHGQYHRLGGTIDDAAGEAFDKVGRLLGLPYPGGPAIQEAARDGDPAAFAFPRAWLPDTYDFSFSGLKTAVLRTASSFTARSAGVERPRMGDTSRSALPHAAPRYRPGTPGLPVSDLAASFQAAVVDVLVTKTWQAVDEYGARQVLLAGGVAANELLRTEMMRLAAVRTEAGAPVPLHYPPLEFCTDNAAMIASAGFYRFQAGERAGWDLDVMPGLRLVAGSE